MGIIYIYIPITVAQIAGFRTDKLKPFSVAEFEFCHDIVLIIIWY